MLSSIASWALTLSPWGSAFLGSHHHLHPAGEGDGESCIQLGEGDGDRGAAAPASPGPWPGKAPCTAPHLSGQDSVTLLQLLQGSLGNVTELCSRRTLTGSSPSLPRA